MRIVVTGSEGYIGSVMMPMLLAEGFDAVGLDACFFADGALTNAPRPAHEVIHKDIRSVTSADFSGFDAVIHLAGLSNDPLGFLDEKLTYDINLAGTVRVAEAARDAGVKRFIFASSCSLYGLSERVLTESDAANPQTAYGRSKVMAEEALSGLAREGFSPTFMRNATAYGISPRMRFDLVVNSLAAHAETSGVIRILGDGTPWRPLVHVRDICAACIAVLRADTRAVHNQAFNVGDDRENYQVKTIAERVQRFYPECAVTIAQKNAGDSRDYQVSFAKLNTQLGFTASVTLDAGIADLRDVYAQIPLTASIFEDRLYTRLAQVQWLLNEGHLDRSLRWVVRA